MSCSPVSLHPRARCGTVVLLFSGSLRYSRGDSFGFLLNHVGCFSRVKKSLRGQCVDYRLLSVSCSLVPLYPYVFNDAPQSRFRCQDLWEPKQVPVFVLSGISLGVFRAWKNLKVDSAWIEDCHLYYAVLFLCILARLAMRHNRVFSLRIFEILNICQFWPPLGSPRKFFTFGKICTWTVRGLESVTYIMQSFSSASSRV